MKTKTEIPEVINAIRIISYSTDQIIQDIAEVNEKPTNEVSLEEVMDWITDNAEEDLTCLNGAIYQDSYGNEIEL